MMAFLLAAYDEEEVEGETRTVLRLHPRLAPYKVAVLPLSKKDELTGPAREVLALARSRSSCATTTRPRPSAGATAARTRSARRYCVTVDFDTLEDRAVTVRERDSMEQERVPDRRPRRLPRASASACRLAAASRDVPVALNQAVEWDERDRASTARRRPFYDLDGFVAEPTTSLAAVRATADRTVDRRGVVPSVHRPSATMGDGLAVSWARGARGGPAARSRARRLLEPHDPRVGTAPR